MSSSRSVTSSTTITVPAGERRSTWRSRSPRTNTQRLVPGVTIANNVISDIGVAGIHYSGDVNPAGQALAAVPFGRIINNTSVVGKGGNAGQSNYAASKAGLIGFSKAVALEVASRGITVNVVAPGMIDTDMTKAITDQAREQWESRIPLQRLGTTEDIASAVCFLASDEASYITGQVLAVNGGMYL